MMDVIIPHKPGCPVEPIEDWDQKAACTCGAWAKRKAEAMTRCHYLIEEAPMMEDLLWAPEKAR